MALSLDPQDNTDRGGIDIYRSTDGSLGTPVATDLAPTTTSYTDADGAPTGLVLRWNTVGGGKRILPLSRNGHGWKCAGMATPRPLYGLRDLIATPTLDP